LLTDGGTDAVLVLVGGLLSGGQGGPAAELLAVVEQTVQPTRASLWLRP
jgi:hypothetical protein